MDTSVNAHRCLAMHPDRPKTIRKYGIGADGKILRVDLFRLDPKASRTMAIVQMADNEE